MNNNEALKSVGGRKRSAATQARYDRALVNALAASDALAKEIEERNAAVERGELKADRHV